MYKHIRITKSYIQNVLHNIAISDFGVCPEKSSFTQLAGVKGQ